MMYDALPTHKHVEITTGLQWNRPSVAERSTGVCNKPEQERKHSTQPCVTHTLIVHLVYHGVDGRVNTLDLSSFWNENQLTLLLGCSIVLAQSHGPSGRTL